LRSWKTSTAARRGVFAEHDEVNKANHSAILVAVVVLTIL
jgi:hypothetical protein